MRYVLGLMLAGMGAWLLREALARRRRVLATRPPGWVEPDASGSSLEPLRHVMPPIINTVLAFVGLKMTIAYAALGGDRYLSPFDLAGFLFLLAAYAVWLRMAVRYRDPAVFTPTSLRKTEELAHEPEPAGADRAADGIRAGPGPLGLAARVAPPRAAPAARRRAAG